MTEAAPDPPSNLPIYLALAVFGATVGFMAGLTGPHALPNTILSALLFVLGGSAASLLLFKQIPSTGHALRAGGIALAVFTLPLAAGSHLGFSYETRHQAALRAQFDIAIANLRRDRLRRALEHRRQRLERCLQFEVQHNAKRQQHGLPPLSSNRICPPHLATAPTPSPQ